MEISTMLSAGALEEIRQHLVNLFPLLWTPMAVIIVAIIPIFTGAHASLCRPSSAAKPSKKRDTKARSKSASGTFKQGLTPSDALLLPLGCGFVLTGMYYLIKWLEDPALLNKILTIQQSIMGTFTIWQLVYDSQTLFYSFVFPQKYSRTGKVWKVADTKREFVSTQGEETKVVYSPLPGCLSTIPLPKWVSGMLWALREARTKPYAVVEIFVKGMGHTVADIYDSAEVAAMVALAAVIYCNFVAKPWWITNLYGFSSCYSLLQYLSPTTFCTGSMLLVALFFYDIYFVFYTPIMLEVATKIDVPSAMLLIPEPSGINKRTGKPNFSMIGLGDIILPGMMLCLALRFDLYMFYLKRQKRQSIAATAQSDEATKDAKPESVVIKSEYVKATGTWGDRFWLDTKEAQNSGGYFPKPYFTVGMIGYVIGLIVTTIVLRISKHGQPALLYLVPAVLGSLWGTAAVRAETRHMWMYTEDETDEKSKQDKKKKAKKDGSKHDQTESTNLESSPTANDDYHKKTATQSAKDDNGTKPSHKTASNTEDRRIFYISITEPESRDTKAGEKNAVTDIEDDTSAVSPQPVNGDSESSFEVLDKNDAKDSTDTETITGEISGRDADTNEVEGEHDGQARKKQRKG